MCDSDFPGNQQVEDGRKSERTYSDRSFYVFCSFGRTRIVFDCARVKYARKPCGNTTSELKPGMYASREAVRLTMDKRKQVT